MLWDILKGFPQLNKRNDRFCVGIAGNAIELKTQIFDSTIAGGSGTHTISATGIPANALILGVTLIIKEIIVVSGMANYSIGRTSQTAYYASALTTLTVGFVSPISNNNASSREVLSAATALILTGNAGTFTSGRVRAIVYSMPMDVAF